MVKSIFIKLFITTLVLSTGTAHAALQTVKTNTAATYAKTKYPIVFNHGMFGFSRLGTPEFGLDYWYKILPDLAANGAIVYATQVSPLNSTEIRGEQLVAQVEEVLAITGANKVNLIGHSHGGPTTRYVAGVIPSKVASVSTVGGDHNGSKVADLVLSLGLGASLIAKFIDATFAPIINYGQNRPDLPNDTMASLRSIDSKGLEDFNKRFPAGVRKGSCGEGDYISNGIYNYSWTGSGVYTNLLDPDSILVSLGPLAFGLSTPHDGLIGTCDAHFGKVIRDNYYLNHFDEVNQVLGLRGLFSPDPVTLFRQHANRLKQQGL